MEYFHILAKQQNKCFACNESQTEFKTSFEANYDLESNKIKCLLCKTCSSKFMRKVIGQ
jgi:hypothetical protein